MNILELLREDGFHTDLIASTNGGEYKGPCPYCGGNDRFCVWPKLGNGGRYWCRRCGKYGDSIQYLRDFKNLSYREACTFLQIPPKPSALRPLPKLSAIWTPTEMKVPTAIWQQAAKSFLAKAVDQLWQDQHVNMRNWLHQRGLSDKTIKAAQMGCHPQDVWVARQQWGLQEIIYEGRRKKLWLPAGLIIPCIDNGKTLRLRVRRFDRTDTWGRYVVVSGSTNNPMQLPGNKDVYLVLESELDAWLVSKKASELTSTIAIGSAQIKPDYGLDKKLQKARLILISLDSDLAGAKQTCRWWLKQYGNARWWPTPLQYGKDPGEAFQKGLNLSNWVRAALT